MKTAAAGIKAPVAEKLGFIRTGGSMCPAYRAAGTIFFYEYNPLVEGCAGQTADQRPAT